MEHPADLVDKVDVDLRRARSDGDESAARYVLNLARRAAFVAFHNGEHYAKNGIAWSAAESVRRAVEGA